MGDHNNTMSRRRRHSCTYMNDVCIYVVVCDIDKGLKGLSPSI